MGILMMIIIGAAAGFIATRIMDVQFGTLQTIAIGIIGALIGGWLIRFLLSMLGIVAGFVGAVFGAVLLIYLYRRFVGR